MNATRQHLCTMCGGLGVVSDLHEEGMQKCAPCSGTGFRRAKSTPVVPPLKRRDSESDVIMPERATLTACPKCLADSRAEVDANCSVCSGVGMTTFALAIFYRLSLA